ncbi:hypothetical protein DL766_007328 [Monosporascus sp. MC13-8B]|nr:hypothetical protein DL763_010289 [Monosporascus cannonballus]RYP24256.1 hypothetical protein DL766_007328 [Monosporascus sp. MC13-8B]
MMASDSDKKITLVSGRGDPESSAGAIADDSESRVTAGEAEDVLALQDLDPALNKKMHLVNDDHTHTLSYAVDSLVLLLQGNIAAPAYTEFGERGYSAGLSVAVYAGMLAGALFWGLGADMIGRRWAFNTSLFVCSTATVVAGAVPNWASLGFFVAVIGFGAGGNLILDTTVFLEYLPGDRQWVLTFLACWWGVGQAVTGFICWGFLVKPKWNCSSVDDCSWDNNRGWRYVMFTAGALVFVLSVLRVMVVRLRETPKYLLGAGEEERLVSGLRALALRYGRPCSLTVQKLEACGPVRASRGGSGRFSLPAETWAHLSGLFATRKMVISTSMIWFSWTLIGLAYPLFYVFLSSYLESRGAYAGVSTFDTWRNYTLTNVSGIFGPALAAWMCDTRALGRRYTMSIGALATMAFFFAYTAVRSPAQNVGFSCAIAFCLNVYYGTLYAYTPEVLPSAHRATGNGVGVACNRLMGILSSVVSTTADTSTSSPIYVCAALFGVMALVSALFPFEPYGRRSS